MSNDENKATPAAKPAPPAKPLVPGLQKSTSAAKTSQHVTRAPAAAQAKPASGPAVGLGIRPTASTSTPAQRRAKPLPPITKPVSQPGGEPGPSSQSVAKAVYSSGGESFVGPRREEQERQQGPRAMRIRVQATQTGYYGEARRRIGDVFDLTDPADFSERWMIRVAPETPERITTGQQVLRQHHDQEIAARNVGSRPMQTAPDHPTGTGDPLGFGDVSE